MKLNNLIEIKRLISIEVSDSIKDIGTKNMRILCDISSYLDDLINRLQNPDKTNKLDKKYESKIWK